MDYDVRELIVLEALLRRISLVNMPFVLKDSLLTRQYLYNPDIRYVDDIDFLYMGKIKDSIMDFVGISQSKYNHLPSPTNR